MQLFGASSPEMLARVVPVPDVEVPNLGSLRRGDSDDGLCWAGKGHSAADGEDLCEERDAW